MLCLWHFVVWKYDESFLPLSRERWARMSWLSLRTSVLKLGKGRSISDSLNWWSSAKRCHSKMLINFKYTKYSHSSSMRVRNVWFSFQEKVDLRSRKLSCNRISSWLSRSSYLETCFDETKVKWNVCILSGFEFNWRFSDDRQAEGVKFHASFKTGLR